MLEIKVDKIINGAFQIVAIVLPHPCPSPKERGVAKIKKKISAKKRTQFER
jgi:hypothetical protein